MKFNKIFNITAAMALAVGATSCSSDYLDLKPEGTLDYETVLTNEEGATLAVNGMCASMYRQYSAINDGSLGFNGEPEMLMYYSEVPGVDYVSTFWILYGGTYLLNWDQERGSSAMNSAGGSQPAWGYLYGLISQANNLITFTPKVLDEQGQPVEEEYGINTNTAYNQVPDINGLYAFRYAQALTIRAHAYIRLLQIYCARYEQRITSDGNWSLTVPLRLEYVPAEGDLSCPLATWEELVNQIYADLAQALDLYQQSNARRTYQWEPDADIAMGLFSRVAMINHDWETAREMASEARAGYSIMTSEEYQQGFAIPNSEWMWTNSGEAQGLYFWSFGATYACNGAYPCRWGTIGAGGINNDLISQFASGSATLQNGLYDLRANLYFSPRNLLGDLKNKFWARDDCNAQTMNIQNSTSGDLHQQFVTFATNRYKNVEDFGWDPPYTYYGAPTVGAYTTCTATFGAQFKFWGTDNYSSSFFPYMRASEMLLTEAEAAYMMGDQTAANDLLRELNVNRYSTNNSGDSRYNATYSGDKLLTAIKLYRRMELWGEGFHWFDMKRWNESMTRYAWSENNKNGTSGNWPETYAKTFDVKASNGWRWRIPSTEINYNEALNEMRSTIQLGYDW